MQSGDFIIDIFGKQHFYVFHGPGKRLKETSMLDNLFSERRIIRLRCRGIAMLVLCAVFWSNWAAAETGSPSAWTATASTVEKDDFGPENVIDGQSNTRWSSPATDPQWVRIDLGREEEVCGLSIAWETAFGQAYAIDLSLDGDNGGRSTALKPVMAIPMTFSFR